jgi:hypothetical protein
MNIALPEILQDTLKLRFSAIQDTGVHKTDSGSLLKIFTTKSNIKGILISTSDTIIKEPVDTTSVCSRNNIRDITFYDSTNFILTSGPDSIIQYPFIVIERTKKKESEIRQALIKHLNPGQELPASPLHNDWTIGIILTVAFLYSLIRNTSKKMLPDIARFFLFRGINDPVSRDIGGLFHWQSTVLNLSSFLIVALFAFVSSSSAGLIPAGSGGIVTWIICLGVIITAVTFRHIICTVTGIISGENEIFREYLLVIYQSYRFSAILLFVIIVLSLYTTVLPEKISLFSGVSVFVMMYLIRIFRLMIIFLNRNISIFYLILYLCALEFLPVVILVKYFTGLV